MTCDLPDDLPWRALLEARDALAAGADALTFSLGERWTCAAGLHGSATGTHAALLVEVTEGAVGTEHADGAAAVYRTDARGLPSIEQPHRSRLDPGMQNAARVYLPVLLGAALARRAGVSFVTAHVTQTLDGRIACENGQSQWIGNAADLHHSHRMRALLDGVMVGANTALNDDPKLNVRHVEGTDPRRVVLSGRARVLREGAQLQVMQGPGAEVFVATEHATRDHDGPATVHAVQAEDGRLAPADVLAELRERGVHSVYLEGGAGVLSSFLQAGAVDLLQVHIASMVLGSGLPSLRLPPVEHVDQGLQLHMDHAILDGHVLLSCLPRT